MLRKIAFGEVHLAEAVSRWLAVAGEERSTEEPIPDRQLRREVLVVRIVVGRMMPPMHLRTVNNILQPSCSHIDVRMDVHAPDAVNCGFQYRQLRRAGKQCDHAELDALIDKDLQGMRSCAREPIDITGRM